MNYLVIFFVYFILLLISNFEHRLRYKKRIVLYFIFTIILSLIFSSREIYTTPDTSEYVEIFGKSYMSDGLFARVERFEGGYCFLNRLVKSLSLNYNALFFFISMFSFSAFYYVIKHLKQETKTFLPLSFLLLYLPYFGLLYNSIVMRACIAIALLYLASIFMIKKKRLISILTFILGVSMHNSVILAFPILLVVAFNLRFSNRTIRIITLLLLFCYFVGISSFTVGFIYVVLNKLSNIFPELHFVSWSSKTIENAQFSGGISIFRLFLLLLIYVSTLLKPSWEKADVYTTICLIGAVVMVFFGGFGIMSRVAEIFLVSICIMIATHLSDNTNHLKIYASSSVLVIPKFILLGFSSIIFLYVFVVNVAFV